MLIHRGIVVGGNNYNMLEGAFDTNTGIDLRDIIATLGTWGKMGTAYDATYETNYSNLYESFDKLNWLLVNTIGFDLIYQLYVNNEHTLILRDDNGDPVITIDFDSVPEMWYATYMAGPGTGSIQLNASSYPAYDTQNWRAGVKFRMLANSTGGPFSVTATRHSDGTTQTFTVYPKKYFVDDFWLATGTQYNSQFVAFCSDDPFAEDMSHYNYALSNPISLYHEIYTRISSGIVTDKIYITQGRSVKTELPSPDYWQYDVIKYDGNGTEIGWNASNINFEDYTEPEDGYMNELRNRFSPRVRSNMTGIYVLPQEGYSSPEEQSGMLDLSRALVKTDLMDLVAKGIFSNDPSQYIVGIRWYYGLKNVIDDIKSTRLVDIAEGPITVSSDEATGIVYLHAHYARSEFVEWHTSKLYVPAKFNNYLDFMANYKLYLPYYGYIDIDANDIVGGTIQVFYNINLSTGVTMITVACNNARTNNAETKYYSVSCSVGEDIPFGADMLANDALMWAQTIGKAAQFALTYGGGAMSATAMQNMNMDVSGVASAVDNGQRPSSDTANEQTASMRKGNSNNQQMLNNGNAMQKAGELAGMVSGPVPSTTRSNGGNAETGSLDELHPYLLITRPVNVEPADYEDYVGLPSSKAVALSTCSGFTQVAAIKPQSMTDAPKYFNEIISLLQAGVYL